MFPSAPPLCSIDSAPAPSGLFADFIARMGRSDFCGSFITGLDLFGLPDADRLAAADPQTSRFPNKELACMPWVYRPRRTTQALASRTRAFCLPPKGTASASWMRILSRFITRPACTAVNASPRTLRSALGTTRMTRGRCDLLGLHRNGLPPSTPCRFSRRTPSNPLKSPSLALELSLVLDPPVPAICKPASKVDYITGFG